MRKPKCYLEMSMYESLLAEFADWCMETGYSLNKYGESIFPTKEVRIRKKKPKYNRISWVKFLGSDLDTYVKNLLWNYAEPEDIITKIISTVRNYDLNTAPWLDEELVRKIRGTIRNARIDLRKEGWDG